MARPEVKEGEERNRQMELKLKEALDQIAKERQEMQQVINRMNSKEEEQKKAQDEI